ncbi:hypothetical protein [Amycolatopsis magusensis]|uniref:ABC-type transporter Mla subunit MlaD n=1 Tax=Amycolatopsis magusensis TaxID=882444 RepID=A0ABS4PTU4_9PSEU|nr:hypothetical protein [Amycolatopsis magusensis]MBP2182851.1 ABC-type transporter Mla subunit MlaD [Amycolatopsis magusensis]
MSDRDTPPPDPDAIPWWEHREVAQSRASLAENLAQKAKHEPENAATLLAQAQVEALLAVYHQTRAAGDHQELLLRQQQQQAQQLKEHAQALDSHSGNLAEHSTALGRHSRAMAELKTAISTHGADVRDALAHWER